ncbi:MAG TPA: helix-turn-helix domain-containing protein [Mycobacteriales bacterium]|nr:helix-turn-helix domain-containing protein [Mycobacteriales bacterium]
MSPARPKADPAKPQADAADPKAGENVARRDVRNVSDPRAMRALAHPMRIALLEALSREGPLTATRAAEILNDSPGNMSWHLQTLAKYGFVEEAGGGRGRSRPWQAVNVTYNFETAMAEGDVATAGEALEATIHEANNQRLREWWAQRRSFPVKWRRAAYSSNSITYLTAKELEQLGEAFAGLLIQYSDRHDKSKRPAGALPVHLVTYGHPLPTISPRVE